MGGEWIIIGFMSRPLRFLRAIFSPEEPPEKFNPAANEHEWLVPGTCIFAMLDPTNPKHKNKLINAWLGTENFGFARMAEVVDITANEYQRIINRLAHYLAENGLARDIDHGFEKATDEVEHTAKLANRDPGSVLIVERAMTPHGVSETFKTVPREKTPEA